MDRWVSGTVDSSTKRLMFFSEFLSKFFAKMFQFIFLFSYNFTKIKIKSFECPKSIKNYEKSNAWNIKRLVDESFVPSTHRPSEPLYYIEDCWIFAMATLGLKEMGKFLWKRQGKKFAHLAVSV